jgi:hypothetical protein
MFTVSGILIGFDGHPFITLDLNEPNVYFPVLERNP